MGARAVCLVTRIALRHFYIGAYKSARSVYGRARIVKTGIDDKASRRDLVMMVLLGAAQSPPRALAYQGDTNLSVTSDLESVFEPLRLQDDERWQDSQSGLISTRDPKESGYSTASTPAKVIVEG